MSHNLNTAMHLGAKAPFILIMKLNKDERAYFIDKITPNIATFLIK